MCMRVADGAFKSKQTRDGADAHFHRLIALENLPAYKPVTVEPDGQRAENDVLHAVYSALLAECPISDSHRLDLNTRKAPQPYGTCAAGSMYGTLRKDGRSRTVAKLREKFGDNILLRVPGFVLKVNGKGERYIAINGKPGLMIPVRDDAGRIVGIKIRLDGATSGGGGKYRWLSSRKSKYLAFDGPSPGTAAHCPLSIKARPVVTLRVTEGPLKADVATNNGDVPTIAADSVGSCLKAIALIEALKPATVRIAFDMDREKNRQVAAAIVKLAGALEEMRIIVEIETWPEEHKGIDDALVAGAPIGIIRGPDVGTYLLLLDSIRNKNGDDSDGRVEIEISVDEHKTNDAAASALTADNDIYQRNGALVWIVRGEKRNDGIRRPDDVPQIVTLKPATVRERLSRVARFGQTCIDPETGESEFIRKPIPKNCVEAIISRGHWPGIRPLEGVVTTPILRRDGSILNTPGYDLATGLMFDPQGVTFSIPERPSCEDAITAAGRLLDLVSDFPFSTPAHKSVWLAGLLTPLARHAFDGPSPLFLFDANVRSAGKTLLAELIALILTGGDFSRMTNPHDDAECRKLITALVLCGDTLVLIDNIAGVLGCPALDAALTGTTWKDRLLGKNERVVGTLGMTWFASGNNVILNGDTTRRTCQSRLESPEEKPEEREGFKYPNVAQYVRDNRPALLADVVTILSAYCLAGRPRANLKPWGSFDGWSNLIRQAVVWVGLDDPGQTRQELSERSDLDAEQLRELIAGWEEVDLDCTGLTCAEALKRLDRDNKKLPDKEGNRIECYPRLRNVLANIYDLKPGELPGAKKLGKKLQHLCGRVCGGKAFDDGRKNRNDVKLWRVVDIAKQHGAGSSAGYAGYAGFAPTILRGMEATGPNGNTHDAHTHACVNRAVANPANPANPATEIPTFVATHAGLLTHKRQDCQSLTGWHHVNAGDYCFACWPPTDVAAVANEGAA